MPKRNSPSKVARDAKGKPVKGTDAQRGRRPSKPQSPEQAKDLSQADAARPALKELTWKRRLFVYYYLGESKGVATDAARKAGYLFPHPEGAQLLQDPTVRAAIEAQASQVGLSSEEVLSRLADIASTDLSDCVDPKTGMVDVCRIIDAGKMHLVREITPTANGLSVKLHSPLEALTLLGKYHKLFIERISLEGFNPQEMTTEQLRAFVAAGKGKQGP